MEVNEGQQVGSVIADESEAVQAEPQRRKDSQCSLKADLYLDGQKAGGVLGGRRQREHP